MADFCTVQSAELAIALLDECKGLVAPKLPSLLALIACCVGELNLYMLHHCQSPRKVCCSLAACLGFAIAVIVPDAQNFTVLVMAACHAITLSAFIDRCEARLAVDEGVLI